MIRYPLYREWLTNKRQEWQRGMRLGSQRSVRCARNFILRFLELKTRKKKYIRTVYHFSRFVENYVYIWQNFTRAFINRNLLHENDFFDISMSIPKSNEWMNTKAIFVRVCIYHFSRATLSEHRKKNIYI